MSFFEEILGCAICSVISFLYYAEPLFFLGSLLGGVLFRSYACLLMCLLQVVLVLLPTTQVDAIRTSWFFRTTGKYFDTQIIYDCERKEYAKQNGKNYLGLLFPHGVISFGGLSGAALGPDPYGPTAAASAIFMLPFLRHVFSFFGIINSDKKTMMKNLKTRDVLLYPGGIAELFLADRDEERLFFSQRKGCVKLALEAQCDILPSYILGNTDMFDIVKTDFIKKLSRKLGVSILFFYGRWFLPIPYRTKVRFVVGKPIRVPKCSGDWGPSQEQIDEVHKQVTEEVKRIFDKYKATHPNYKTKELVMT
mmetsp:Transcript_15572/g.31605  ORF Transcript_15572/g.31605 Transcript_15572/m.31605 type:complete len:308 (+) Transcript_15572:181-1104(+)